ncbi:SDR family oxidoreductase [Novosphingobium sp.]|uniref:SDR family oxidoreductase n=1 Tax=Novosphingobium sp. TaxID=1874826 RepID=UPI0026305183|nr:SDR family oxidoreductase [Novosphingobium sp.]
MTHRLTGRTALITGAAQGIGLAIGQAFLAEGATVVATDIAADRLEAAYAGTAAITMVLDVTDEAAVEAAATRHAAVDVLVNCAGWVASGTILETPRQDFDRSWQLNVVAMASMIRAFLPAMRARRDGSIINIASVVSSVMAAPNRCAYATTKAAVIGLTMSVARDFIADGIRCNAISPGTVDSPSLAERLAATGDAAAARAAFVSRQPMGRIGTPEEIAAVAVLLASGEATFMSGSNVVIDGGMSL